MLKNFPEWIAKGTFSQPRASKKQKAEISCRIGTTAALMKSCECYDNRMSRRRKDPSKRQMTRTDFSDNLAFPSE